MKKKRKKHETFQLAVANPCSPRLLVLCLSGFSTISASNIPYSVNIWEKPGLQYACESYFHYIGFWRSIVNEENIKIVRKSLLLQASGTAFLTIPAKNKHIMEHQCPRTAE